MSKSMIYDGRDFADLLHIEAVRRPMAGDRSADVADWHGRGGRLKFVATDAKRIEVDVRAFSHGRGRAAQGRELEGIRRELGALLVRDEPRELVLPDAPDLYDLAVLDGSTALERVSCSSKATLTFLCPEAASYGVAETVEMPEGGTAHCRIDGNTWTAPVVMVQASAPFTVSFDGVPFQVLGTPTGYCGVDAVKHEVTCAGASVRYDITSDFPVWEPGRHTIACELPFTARWRPRWL